MNEKKDLKWYDSGHTVTSLIISSILIIIICSQSFAIGEGGSLALFSSVINHYSIYLLVLIYFILLKFPIGKKYFNYINVFLVFIYFIATITSALTVIQSFSLNTVFSFTLNFLFVIYLSHTLFRDTRIWKEFYFYNSPFNELTNDWLFNAIVIVSLLLLAVNLISVSTIRGVVLSILDNFYFLLFGRYIFLYRAYLDDKKIDVDNQGNFDSVREQVQDVLDKTDLDEKVVEIKDRVVDSIEDTKTNVEYFIKEAKEITSEMVSKDTEKENDSKKKKSKTVRKKTTRSKSTEKNDKKGDK